jgi:hypothetical protein
MHALLNQVVLLFGMGEFYPETTTLRAVVVQDQSGLVGLA